MSFFNQMMKDAQPKADTLKKATVNVTNRAVNSKAITAAKNLGYKGLVNTVGVAACLAAPVCAKVWNKVEELASAPVAVEVKK